MKSAEGARGLIRWPRRPLSHGAELEFLPAALEIVETPASPAGRAIGATIILFFAVAIVWAIFGRVDIIATAPGKIVPTGRSKVVQPFETGVVRAIHVQDGQEVKAGEVLVELDPTISDAERDRLAAELLAKQLDVARLRAALDGGVDPARSFVPPEGASPQQVELQRTLLTNQVEEQRAKLASLDRQVAKDTANQEAVAAGVQKLTVAIPLLRQRAEARKYLAEKGVGSKLEYLQVEQDLLEHEQELQVQRARLTEAAAGLAALREQRLEAEAEYRGKTLSDLSEAEQKAAGLQDELVKARSHAQLQTLTAPVAGTVQELAVHTIGGVVTPAQPLMVIVPAESRLEIDAMVSNQDIGFVHAGEPADVKVDTFNFTRYGLIHGTVLSVSQDAIARDKPQEASQGSGSGVLTESSEPRGQELAYAARLSLDRTTMQVENKTVHLTPGMAVTVEIKTGSRRVISYLLSPVLRYKQAAFRER
jgi:membrane fusion protein, hemolysin D